MHALTYLSYFDVLCVVCRAADREASIFTDQPLYAIRAAAVNSNKITHNIYDYHATTIGFVAAPQIAAF